MTGYDLFIMLIMAGAALFLILNHQRLCSLRSRNDGDSQ